MSSLCDHEQHVAAFQKAAACTKNSWRRTFRKQLNGERLRGIRVVGRISIFLNRPESADRLILPTWNGGMPTPIGTGATIPKAPDFNKIVVVEIIGAGLGRDFSRPIC